MTMRDMIATPETSKFAGASERGPRASRVRLLLFAKIATSMILLAWLLHRASLQEIFASMRKRRSSK